MPKKESSSSTSVLPNAAKKTAPKAHRSTAAKKAPARAPARKAAPAPTARKAPAMPRAKKAPRSTATSKKAPKGGGLPVTVTRDLVRASSVRRPPQAPTVRVFELREKVDRESDQSQIAAAEHLRRLRELTRLQREAIDQLPVPVLLPSLTITPALGALRKSVELVLSEVDLSGLKDLRKLLKNPAGATLSIGARSAAVPSDVVAVFSQVLESLERGALTMIEGAIATEDLEGSVQEPDTLDLDQQISSQDAADILNVSRPYVVKLAQQGALPHRKVGNRHRFLLRDVLAYDQQMAVTRAEALRQIAPEGGYTAEDF